MTINASGTAAVPVQGIEVEQAIDRLEALGTELNRHGLSARLHAPRGRLPALAVANPAAPALSDHVLIARCQDGSTWFWWSFAERIAPIDDLDQAAIRVVRVLRASDGQPS